MNRDHRAITAMRNVFYFICIVLLGSCDPLTDDFVSILFDNRNAELSRVCSHNPSILSDGRFIEIYHLSADTEENFRERFSNRQLDSVDIPRTDNNTYFDKYRNRLRWRKTPVGNEDLIVYQVADDIGDEKLDCFEKADIIRLLKSEGNYYAFFYGTSGTMLSGYRLYIVEGSSHKMYLLTSYP